MKKTILLIGLGVAFVAVSAWVFCSGGRSARAVRAKFRLGGAILTITSALTAASCGSSAYTCYDPVMPPRNMVNPEIKQGAQLRNGDIVPITIYSEFAAEAEIYIESKNGVELQRETITLTGDDNHDTVEFVIAVGDYLGEAVLKFCYDEECENKISFKEGEIPIVIVE